MKSLNNLNKNTKRNMITYGIVVAMFVFCFVYTATGAASNLFQGILVPICVNVILAISLNLTSSGFFSYSMIFSFLEYSTSYSGHC